MTIAAAAPDRLRIAQLSESDGPGGAERMLADLSIALAEGDADVVAFLPIGGEGWLARELSDRGIPIEHYPPGGPLAADVQHAIAYGLHRHRVSVVHSHDFAMSVAGAWAARRLEIPHVITMHGSRHYNTRMRRRLAMRAAVSLSSATIAASRDLANDLRRDLWLATDDVSIIPSGLRSRHASAPPRLRAELRIPGDDHLVLAVGHLYHNKGHRDLLDAIALLPPPFDRTHVAIAGRGPLEEALRAHAQDLGVADRVHLLGLRADVPDLLAGADLFVLPSHQEGLSIALLEAMAAGLPIVATDVGDTSEALDLGAAGSVVPARSPARLSTAIHQLLADPAIAMALGRRAAHRARAFYSHDTMLGRYQAVYHRAAIGQDSIERLFTPAHVRAAFAPHR